MVDEAVHHLLHWASSHETLRLADLHGAALDSVGWRLGVALDRRQ